MRQAVLHGNILSFLFGSLSLSGQGSAGACPLKRSLHRGLAVALCRMGIQTKPCYYRDIYMGIYCSITISEMTFGCSDTSGVDTWNAGIGKHFFYPALCNNRGACNRWLIRWCINLVELIPYSCLRMFWTTETLRSRSESAVIWENASLHCLANSCCICIWGPYIPVIFSIILSIGLISYS